MNSFDLGLAVLSAAAYVEGRNIVNLVPAMPGATPLSGPFDYKSDPSTGFEVSAYEFQGKIVIAFAGTNPSQSGDLLADAALGVGLVDAQLKQAVDFYQAIKAQYGAAEVVFTGHSLGGGLAALMGGFFNKQAVTFDQGPFRLAATQANAQRLQDYITHATGLRGALPADVDLASFTNSESPLNPELAAILTTLSPLLAQLSTSLRYATNVRGESNITSYAVSGEFLTAGLGVGPTPAQLNALRLQGSASPQLIDINPTAEQLGYLFPWQRAVALHSMALLIAAAEEPALVPLVEQMPAVLKAFFDKTLYSHESSDSTADFLTKLLQNEFGSEAPTGVIDRFVAELQRLGSAGVTRSTGIEDGLIATIIEYYNYASPLDTTPFTHLGSNGLTFDLSRIASTSDFRGQERLLEALGQQVDVSARMRALAVGIPAKEWTVQAGENQLFTPGTDAGEVQIGGMNHSNDMHGGAGDDLLIDGSGASTLDGGSGNDVVIGGGGADLLYGGLASGSEPDKDYLEGGAGDDSLIGGRGNDELYGGAGNDTYNFFSDDGSDIIVDSDGDDEIFVDGVQVTAGQRLGPLAWHSADGRFIIQQQQLMLLPEHRSALIIYDSQSTLTITVQGWSAGEFGINLTGSYPNPGETAGDVIPVSGGGSGLLFSASSLRRIDYLDYFHSPGARWTARPIGTGRYNSRQIFFTEDTEWPPATQSSGSGDVRSYLDMDNLRGGVGNDRVFGLAGNDSLEGREGADYLDGGDGSDLLLGGLGGDQLIGGAGNDLIVGDRYNTTVGLALGSQYGDAYEPLGGGATVEFNGLGWGVERLGPFGSIASSVVNGVTSDYLGGASDIIDAGAGDDRVQGGDGDDVIDGGEGDDEILGEAGDDIANGGLGDDFIVGDGHQNNSAERHIFTYSDIVEQGRDTLHGGDDNDRLIGGGNDDRLYGDEGNDILEGDDGDFVTIAPTAYGRDLLEGGAGDDFLYGGGNDDTLSGGEGVDVLRGDADNLAGEHHGRDTLSGDAGNDTLAGGGNDDRLFGGDGDDFLIGDADAPALAHTWHGDDRLDGGLGNDRLLGGGGSDTLYGGEGADEIFGDQGSAGLDASVQLADFIDGGAGDDDLAGGGGDDTVLGGDGADFINGDDSEDRTPATAHGDDSINAGAGNDIVFGAGGDDSITGGNGDDQLLGDDSTLAAVHHGSDYISGGLGNDQIWGDAGDDVLYGNEGDDQIQGDNSTRPELTGADYLDGGAGNDTLFGQAGDDVLIGALGNDALLGGDGDDELNGGEGDDTLFGGAGNDTLHGGTGNDLLQGGAGDDVYVFDGEDLRVIDSTADGIVDTEGNNRIVFRSGIALDEIELAAGALLGTVTISQDGDTLGLVLDNALSGAVSSFTFSDGTLISANRLIGSRYQGNASQSSSSDNAVLLGGTADDTIAATGANATISGGMGNDLLQGGQGSTTYLFESGDGADTIDDVSTYEATGGTSRNRLEFGVGITSSSLSLSYSLSDGSLALRVGSDSVRVTSFDAQNVLSGARTVDEVRFADGTLRSWAQLVDERGILIENSTNVANYSGTSANDRIVGAAMGETVNAGAGDDILESSGGNDVLTGGTGSDTYVFAPGGGADTIVNTGADSTSVDRVLVDATLEPTEVSFYRVADSLLVRIDGTQDQLFVNDYFGSAGLDQIVFNDGTVYTLENIPLDELPQNELTYSRGAGLQTFAVNDPSDSIYDRLRFGSNVDPTSVFLGSNSNGDLVIRFRNPDGSVNAADRVTITGGVTNPAAVLNQIVFDANPATVWNLADIQSRARLPSELGDFIYGTASDEVLNGLAGNDTINGGAGADVLDGDEGSDVLNGGDGNDIIWGEADDQARGDAGDDLLIAQNGIGSLFGGAGSDTYLVHRGRGTFGTSSLVLADVDSAPTSTDVLTLGPGISAADLRVRQSGNDLRIEVVDRSQPGRLLDNQIIVVNYFLGSSLNTVVDQIRFSDDPSLVWTLADVRAQLLIGDELNDVINGSATSEVLRGNGGDDVLNALGGNDDVDGGTGRDQLNGGDGDDVYRLGLGYGSDEILETSGTDRIELGAGISPAGVTLYRSSSGGFLGSATPFSGDSLVIVIDGSNEQLLVENYFAAGDAARVEEIRFADGTVWDSAAIAAAAIDVSGTADTQTGTAADDTFTVNHALDVVTEAAGAGTDTITSTVSYALSANVENLTLLGTLSLRALGNSSNNTLIGNAGNNVLDGGQGLDTLIGGAGDDTYVVDQVGTSAFDSHYSNFQDIVVEQANEGLDTIIAVTYSAILPVNIERFILAARLTGATSFPNDADTSQRFIGNALDNYIDASVADPYFGAAVLIDGGAGADVMIGNGRRNVYIVDNADDVIVGETVTSVAVDRVESYIDYTLDDRIENLTLRGTVAISGTGNGGANVIIGNNANNVLSGGAGNDTLDGGIGLDTMIGATGDDTYTVDATGDQVTEYANEGTDVVTSRINYVLGANVENLSLLDSATALVGTGNDLNNVIAGNNFNNVLDGRGGDDRLAGGFGFDSYVGFGTSSGVDVIVDGGGFDEIHLAVEQDFTMDQLQFSRSGNDLLIDLSAASSVRVQGWFLSANNQVERFYLTHQGLSYRYEMSQLQAAIAGVNGGPLQNVALVDQSVAAEQALQYQFAANTFTDIESQDSLVYSATLSGGASLPAWLSFDPTTRTFSGAPTPTDVGVVNVFVTATDAGGLSYSGSLFINVTPRLTTGTAADDTLTGNDAADIIHGLQGNDLLLGLGGVDQLFGEEGDDTLDGGAGADDMRGGSGNDVYIVDDAGDAISEVLGEGTDEVRTTVTHTLGLTVENLVLLGTQAIGGTGNFFNNYIVGNAASNALSGGDGNDTLDGGASNDSMSGGWGDDVFFVDHANDTTSESSGQGSDTVKATLNWTLASNVENLVLLGNGNINGTGNSLANQLTGNAGNNALNGGSGADTLTGGAGNDTYTVDNTGDAVVENAGEGIDLVQSGATVTLSANLENLTLTGTSAINGTGNALDNVITGNSVDNTLNGGDGNDTINGGSGVDTMSGGLGNDTYVVAQAGDIVNENAGEGTDLVQSSIAWALGTNVENLTLTGSSGIAGTGNALNNILIGNTGANTLTGGDGNDTLDGGSGTDNMSGGQGDDVYFVNTSSDVTTEAAGQGLDTVNSSVTRTLGADIELLFLTGTSAINGTGNGLSNLLRGSGVNNTLTGGAAIDILEGGAGNDTLSNTTNKSLLNGGADTDTLTGTAVNDLLIGGAGNDALTTGAGADIIVFNRGDGLDTVAASTTRDNTVSIGGAVYADLLFQKNGNDLVLQVGATDRITFVGYYTSSSNRSVNNLQVVIEGTSEYDSGSADAMRNNKIETFNFEGLVAAFDAARTANPTLTTWALTNALLTQHLSGSDTAAIGGDLAYRYNRFGTLSDISFTPALGILGASGFGTTAQALQGLASLQDSSARLS